MLIAAIHGIMTNQTDPSWPDKLDAWMFQRDPEVKVLKKEYRAGPFPRWNCWVKDPLLAHSLANELELFLSPTIHHPSCPPPPVWFVAHSNGAVIALLTAQRLIQRGHRIGGMILTGAACEADIGKNHILDWYGKLDLGAAIAYSSTEDHVLAGDSRTEATRWRKTRDWLWGRLMWPYGCLGRTGWIWEGKPLAPPTNTDCEPSSVIHHPSSPLRGLFTRWYSGGHGTYFEREHLERSFEQIYQDIQNSDPCWHSVSDISPLTTHYL
jgi:pimeloyl-ACP methyl ester carboxylesterase